MRPCAHRTLRIAACLMLAAALLGTAGTADDKLFEFSGTVTYPDGRPAAGAKIEYVMSGTCSDTSVVTDQAGRYAVRVKPGTWYMDTTFGDYVGMTNARVAEDGTVTGEPNIALRMACLVLGEVVDAATGQPVEAADIFISGRFGGGTKTSADGLFKLRIAPIDSLTLEVKRKGYVTDYTNFTAEGKLAMAFRVALKAGGVIHGRVTDKSGQPVEGIRVNTHQNQVYSVCSRTGPDGRYELRDIDPAIESPVYVSGDGYSSSAAKTAVFPPGSMETTLDFEVDRIQFRTITGRVTDSSGVPVAGAEVRFGTSTCAGNRKWVKTDPDGNYEIRDVSPRADMILVKSPGFAPAFLPVDADKDQRIDATLEQPHWAKGRMVDAAGKPIPNVSISVNVRTPVLGRLYDTNHVIGADIYREIGTTTADKNGEFDLNDLPAAGVVLGVWEEDRTAPGSTAIRVDSADNVIVMRGKPMLGGKVVDAVTGAPVQRFAIQWGTAYNENTSFDTPDGTFKVKLDDDRFLSTTDYQVKASARGYLAEAKSIKTTEFPNVDYSVIFRLAKTLPIKGRVVDDSGKGIADASVTILENSDVDRYRLSGRENASQAKVTTDAQGGFVVDPAPSQTVAVIATRAGFPRVLRRNLDASRPLTIVLPTPAFLEVLSKEATRVWLSAEDSTSRQPDSSEGGRTEFRALEPGKYRIQVDMGRHSMQKHVTLKPNRHEIMDIDAIPRPVIIRGTAMRRGRGAANIVVSVYRGDGNWSCATDQKGEYDIAIETPGEVTLHWYESQPHGRSRWGDLKPTLKPGENKIDIPLPGGIVSGTVVDAGTGLPLTGKRVQVWRKAAESLPKGYRGPESRGFYYLTDSFGETTDGGAFRLDGISSGDVYVAVGEQYGDVEYIGPSLKMTQDGNIDSVVARVEKLGKVDLSVTDSASGEPVAKWNAVVVPSGRIGERRMSDALANVALAPGDYTLWVTPQDGRHERVGTPVKIEPGKCANVRVKIPKARQRIVFEFPKDGRFGNLDWSSKPRDWSRPADGQKSAPWVGFSLSDAHTGKPVLSGPYGSEWGGVLERTNPRDELAIPLKPGTYLLDAVLRDTYGDRVDAKTNLWHTKTKVTLTPGKDARIEVK